MPIPIIRPMTIGSPKIPKRFSIVSGDASIFLNPGIRSNNQFNGQASRMGDKAIKWVIEIPGNPKNLLVSG